MMMQGWESGWWVVGAAFMVFCMVMMVWMMGMGMGHAGHGGGSERGGDRAKSEPEHTLADRLAKGEIDVEEYERRLETLRRTDPAHTRPQS